MHDFLHLHHVLFGVGENVHDPAISSGDHTTILDNSHTPFDPGFGESDQGSMPWINFDGVNSSAPSDQNTIGPPNQDFEIHNYHDLSCLNSDASFNGTGIHSCHNVVPWVNFTHASIYHDTDHDGIPDALDRHLGPGGQELPPGEISSGVPWEQITPAAMHRDTDNDGIPDALDNNLGPGAEALPPGDLSSGVPWIQATPEAMLYDSDHDGIPDALDNYLGPGAI